MADALHTFFLRLSAQGTSQVRARVGIALPGLDGLSRLKRRTAAIEAVQHYLAEMLRLRGLAMTSQHLQLAQRLLDWIEERWPEPAIYPAAIYNDCPATTVRNTKTAMAIIKTLQDHGWLADAPADTIVQGVRRKHAWIVHGRTLL